jgi:hypothetical protein
MVDQTIVDYLLKGLKQGHSIATLRQSLLDQGWGESDVQQALSLVQSQIDQSAQEQLPKQGSSRGKKIGAVVVIVVVVAIALFIYVYGEDLFGIAALDPSNFQNERCNGFRYFTYEDQSATNTEFTIDIRNGMKDIQIRALQVGGVMTRTPEVTAQYNGSWISQGQPITVKMGGLSLPDGSYDSLEVIIIYDVKDGIIDNTDSAICVGDTI